MNGPFVMLAECQGLLRIRRVQDGVPVPLQNLAQSIAERPLVFHEQNSFRSAEWLLRRDFQVERLADTLHTGKVNHKGRSLSLRTCYLDVSPALFDNPIHRRESEAGPLTFSLGREKRFEDSGPRISVHS